MDIKAKEKEIFDKLRKIDPSIVEDGIGFLGAGTILQKKEGV